MTFENDIGYSVEIESDLSVDKVLFSETGGFVVEVSSENINIVKSVFLNYGLDVFEIGFTGGEQLKMNSVVNLPVVEAKDSWTNGLRKKL